MKWIDIEDKQPEFSGPYICWIEEITDLGISKYAYQCLYDYEAEYDKWHIGHVNIHKVTHWMTLPTNPNNK